MKIASLCAGCITILLVNLVVRGPAVAEPNPVVIERVSITQSAQKGFVVRLHASDRIPAYSEPRRVGRSGMEITLFNVSTARDIRKDAPAGPVTAYELTSENNHLTLRLTLDSATPVIASAYRDGSSPDLLIGLSFRGEARPVAVQSPPVVNTSTPANRTRSSSGERWRLDTIVIDAGHGGKDHGAVANGVREKDIVLSVAKKVGQYIEDNLDVNVVYTRSNDTFIELRDRGRIANEVGGKLFLSIHANSARNRSATGTETFFLGPHKTEAARRVMETENRVVLMESDPDHYQQMDEADLIRQTLAQSSFVRKGEELADVIEHEFADRVGRKSRGVKQAPFYVLWSASMPAVLVELGFITNPGEAAFLASEQGQTYLASAIFRAVRTYKEQYERGLNLVGTD